MKMSELVGAKSSWLQDGIQLDEFFREIEEFAQVCFQSAVFEANLVHWKETQTANVLLLVNQNKGWFLQLFSLFFFSADPPF